MRCLDYRYTTRKPVKTRESRLAFNNGRMGLLQQPIDLVQGKSRADHVMFVLASAVLDLGGGDDGAADYLGEGGALRNGSHLAVFRRAFPRLAGVAVFDGG